jgi:hypothetical protein
MLFYARPDSRGVIRAVEPLAYPMGRCPPPEALRSSRSCVSSMPSIPSATATAIASTAEPGPARVRRGAAGRATFLSTTLTSHISENSLLQNSRRGPPRRVPSGPPRERVEATGPRPKTTEPLTGESKTQDLDNCRPRLGGPADQHADPFHESASLRGRPCPRQRFADGKP